MSKLPYATPHDLGLPGRPGYEITEESRFSDPDAGHLASCDCGACVDRERCAKCGKRGGRTDCSTCRILSAPPHVRPAFDYPDNDGTENYTGGARNGILPRRRREEKEGWDGWETHAKKQCAKCGHTIAGNLQKRGDTYECLNKANCDSMVRVTARLHLVKPGEKP